MKLIDDLFVISAHSEDEHEMTYSVRLNPEHYIYQAHFPGNPITPGVCMLQIATELLEHKYGRPFNLSVVNNVKYLSIISPVENPCVDYYLSLTSQESGESKVKVVISSPEKIFAKISLTYTHE